MLEHISAAISVRSLPLPNPGLPGFGHFSLPEAGKPAAGWGRVGEGGDAVTHRRCPTQRPPPLTPPHKGEGKCTESAGGGKVEPAAQAV